MATRRRRLALTATTSFGAAALVAATLMAAPAQAAEAPTPTAAARQAGIRAVGQAYMGWSHRPSTATPGPAVEGLVTQTPGIDVSSWQGNVSWSSWWSAGKRFAYVKATESTGYRNPYFAQQYNGSYAVGMIRGAYHFALPDRSGGWAQANYFVDHGGGWSRDGKTLPGVLDIEYNPYGATCYGLSTSQMSNWIASFLRRYHHRTGRDAVIYTTTDWWTRCTGNTSRFSTTNPLWIARYASTPGSLPSGWPYQTFWQYTSSPIDQDYFNGDLTRLRALALG